MSPADLQELAAVAGEDGIAKLHWVATREKIKALARMIYQVDRVRTEHPDLHRHLYKMIRFSQEEAEATRDGFPLNNLEAGALGNLFLRATRPWQVMNLLNKCRLSRIVPFQSYLLARSSSAIGLLTVPGFQATDLFRGGMALQRVWLTLTRQGMAMQPMSALSLFLLRWQLEGESSFPQRHRRPLRDIFSAYQGLFPDLDFGTHAQVLLFRVGYAEPSRHFTYRKEFQSFVVQRADATDLVVAVADRFRQAEPNRRDSPGLAPPAAADAILDPQEKPLCS